MTHRRHCDNCGTSIPEVYLYTDQSAAWLSAEERKPHGVHGGYSTERLDFCTWDCLASYAMAKVLNPESA